MDLFDIAVARKLAGGGGGGGSSYTLLAEGDFDVLDPPTTSGGTLVKTLNLGASAYTSSKMLYVRIRLTSDYTKPHFCFTNSFCINTKAANGLTSTQTFLNHMTCKLADDTWYSTYDNAFVYVANVSADGDVTIRARGSSSYQVNGSYHVEVYALEWPDDVSPFTA